MPHVDPASMRQETPNRHIVTAARRRLLIWAIVLAVMTVVSILWATPPAREFLHPQQLLALLEGFSGHPAAPWFVLAGFLVGGLLVLPVTLMVVIAVAAFGPLTGFLYALGGATLSGTLSFAIGRRLGHRQVERLAGSRLHAVSRKLSDAGITAVAAVRMVPVAHFTVVSLVAGASHIRARDFVAGTVLGMAPGIGAIAIFFEQFAMATREPSLEHFLWLVGVSVAILATLLTIRRLVRRR